MKLLKDNKGNATVLAVAVSLAVIMLMCVVFEYLQMLIITEGIKQAVQSSVISAVGENYDDAYSQLREGYSGGYKYHDDEFSESIDTWDIYGRLDHLLGLTTEENKHIKYRDDGTVEYIISNLQVEFENTDFAQDDNRKNLNATIYTDIEIPVRFGGRELIPIKYTMKVKSAYTPKF